MPSLLFITLLVIACLHAGAFGAPSCHGTGSNACVAKCKSKHGMHGHSSYIPTSSGYTVQSSSAADEGASTTSTPATQPTPASTPSAAPSTSPSTSTSVGVSSADIKDYLDQHNNVRAKHGASPLTWNDTLSAAAQKWADGCKFVHSGGKLGPFGENLAAGTNGSNLYTIDAAVQDWAGEVAQYSSINPQPSHFTQIVWKGTTQVGCAVQPDCSGIFDPKFGPEQYYVCEYSPAGNVIGEFAQNVQA